jgi:hypothetical protein
LERNDLPAVPFGQAGVRSDDSYSRIRLAGAIKKGLKATALNKKTCASIKGQVFMRSIEKTTF